MEGAAVTAAAVTVVAVVISVVDGTEVTAVDGTEDGRYRYGGYGYRY